MNPNAMYLQSCSFKFSELTKSVEMINLIWKAETSKKILNETSLLNILKIIFIKKVVGLYSFFQLKLYHLRVLKTIKNI